MVVKFIESAKQRHHCAYCNVDMAAVKHKAVGLPECGVPPEIAKPLPLDNVLDKICIQKAATPVSVPRTLEEVAQEMSYGKPNGVVLEKSSFDEADINAQRIAALKAVAERLQVEVEIASSSDESSDESMSCRTLIHEASKDHTEAASGIYSNMKLITGHDAANVHVQRAVEWSKRVERFTTATGNEMIDQF